MAQRKSYTVGQVAAVVGMLASVVQALAVVAAAVALVLWASVAMQPAPPMPTVEAPTPTLYVLPYAPPMPSVTQAVARRVHTVSCPPSAR